MDLATTLKRMLDNGVPFVPGPGLKLGRKTVADAAYQILPTNYYVAYTSLSAARTVTLPAVADVDAGYVVVVADESGSAATYNITVDGSGSETIDGALTKVITDAYGRIGLISTGTGWKVLFYSGGPLVRRVTLVNDAAYSILVTDSYVGYTALSAGRTATLPAIASVTQGTIITLKDEAGGAGTNNLTLKGNGSENIDGANTSVISTNYGKVSVIARGTKWHTI